MRRRGYHVREHKRTAPKSGKHFAAGRANALVRGIKIEAEHEPTYTGMLWAIQRGQMPDEAWFFKHIAMNHLDAYGDKYYKALHWVEQALKSDRKIRITGKEGGYSFCIGFAASNRALEAGTKVESEHKHTFQFMMQYYKEHGKLPDKRTFYRMIAQDHITEFPNYYDPLPAMMNALKHGRTVR